MRVTRLGHLLGHSSETDESELGPDTHPDPRFGSLHLELGATSGNATVVMHRDALHALMRASGPHDQLDATVTISRAALPLKRVVPCIVKSSREIACLPLDSRRLFLLSFIDGQHSIGEIVEACGMPDALHQLVDLVADGVIGLE